MSLSDMFRKLFARRAAELTAERDALQQTVTHQLALIKSLQSEALVNAGIISRLRQQLDSVPVPARPVPPVQLEEKSAQ